MFFKNKYKLKEISKEEEELALLKMCDFIEGRISTKQFWEILNTNENLKTVIINDKMRYSVSIYDQKTKEFHAKYDRRLKKPSDLIFNINPDNMLQKINIEKLQDKYGLFNIVFRFLKSRKIEFKQNNEDINMFLYLNSFLPNWIEVEDVEFLEKIYNSSPKDLNRKEKTDWCKKKILKLFKYDNKRPLWLQQPEWPVVNDTPYVFSHQETTEEGFERYYFYNPNNKTEIIKIEQCE